MKKQTLNSQLFVKFYKKTHRHHHSFKSFVDHFIYGLEPMEKEYKPSNRPARGKSDAIYDFEGAEHFTHIQFDIHLSSDISPLPERVKFDIQVA